MNEAVDAIGASILYQIDPSLEPTLPAQDIPEDARYNVPDHVARLQLNIKSWKRYTIYDYPYSLPRLLWVNKNQTLKELHFTVFRHMRQVFSYWVDLSQPVPSVEISPYQRDLRTITPFPYKIDPSSR